VGVQEGFTGLNGFAKDVDIGNIFLIHNRASSGFICVTSNPNTVKMSVWNQLNGILQDTMIFFAVELFILQKFNPCFFEKVVVEINRWYK